MALSNERESQPHEERLTERTANSNSLPLYLDCNRRRLGLVLSPPSPDPICLSDFLHLLSYSSHQTPDAIHTHAAVAGAAVNPPVRRLASRISRLPRVGLDRADVRQCPNLPGTNQSTP